MLWEASVLDPNEVSRAFPFLRPSTFTFLRSRVFVSMALLFLTAKKFSHLHPEAKR